MSETADTSKVYYYITRPVTNPRDFDNNSLPKTDLITGLFVSNIGVSVIIQGYTCISVPPGSAIMEFRLEHGIARFGMENR